MTTPNLASLITGRIDERFDQLNTCRPGRIQSYNSTTGLASVKPLIQKAFVDEAGDRQVAPLPVIPSVPVIFPGSGGVRIKFPVLPGDLVLLLFSSASLDRWLIAAEDVDPADDRAHALTDAIAIPGLLHRASDASPQIEFTLAGEIHAGGSSALALLSELNDLRSKHNSHTHPSNGAAPTTGLVASPYTGTDVLKGG